MTIGSKLDKIEVTLFAVIVTLFLFGLAFWFTASSRFNYTMWVETKDWTTTDQTTGKTYHIEFGFRNDGSVIWKRGNEIH